MRMMAGVAKRGATPRTRTWASPTTSARPPRRTWTRHQRLTSHLRRVVSWHEWVLADFFTIAPALHASQRLGIYRRAPGATRRGLQPSEYRACEAARSAGGMALFGSWGRWRVFRSM